MKTPANFSIKECVTTRDAAAMLGVTPVRIRQLIQDGSLTGHAVTSRMWLIPRTEIERHRRSRRKPGRPVVKS